MHGTSERPDGLRAGQGGGPPSPVDRPAMLHVWSDLSFLHWPCEESAVQRLLPSGLEVDAFEGSAWIGLIPFHVRIRHLPWPAVPWVSSFQEINVRTYVRGPGDEEGIYFLSLDAARAAAVVVARLGYGLNYAWARMRYRRIASVATYECTRLFACPRAGARIVVAAEEVCTPGELTDLDLWLTDRWRYYCERRGRLMTGVVDHQPWPFRRARVLECAESLVAACGLPSPEGVPRALFSPRVDVRMSALADARSTATTSGLA